MKAAISMVRRSFIVQGQVQGVGFRPFVFILAQELQLTGSVCNTPQGVVIEVQGSEAAIGEFHFRLMHTLPPLARITHLSMGELSLVADELEFTIKTSTQGSTHAVLISPDTAMCSDCLTDMRSGRRAGYPFTNCTNCGPRYTITRSIPYDRACTSMACFPLCAACRAEYKNPRDRRFHAQPNACPVCGPHVWFVRNEAVPQAGSQEESQTRRCETSQRGETQGVQTEKAAVRELATFLLEGGIAAVKGLGGFHLVCDACNAEAVARLRERKGRPHKPFAVMVADIDTARAFAVVTDAAERLLTSAERPIVLCPMRQRPSFSWMSGQGQQIATVERGNPLLPVAGLSPDTSTVGIMLPYTPLHHVIFQEYAALCAMQRLPVLVMTSGNLGGEPICLGNREAQQRLGHMVGAFLFHNRDILVRVDDSVVRPLSQGKTLYFRRARGYVPRPTPMLLMDDAALSPEKTVEMPTVLGVGAELKNTICFTKGNDAFVSQHIGDMGNEETAFFHQEMTGHLSGLLKVSPALVVRDQHPNYLSSAIADAMQSDTCSVLRLQHHYAHAHAVLAEHRYEGEALVVVLDGTGLGEDGTLWGGEILRVNTQTLEHQRLAHCAPMPLVGGAEAIREPWRIAHALLLELGLLNESVVLPWLPHYAEVAALLPAILARRINTPYTTSVGRLFDAVSALLGLCLVTTYEGQAAIRLEEAREGVVEEEAGLLYPCPLLWKAKTGEIDTHALFAALVRDWQRGSKKSIVAQRFHRSLAAGLVLATAELAQRCSITHVGLSGGCLQNLTLNVALQEGLSQRGLVVLSHEELPPNDGCIALGQAAWGWRMLRRGC